MKKGILLLLLLSTVFANAQTLKEALYSGKLKNEAGTVIRKGDDLSAKMDTARKPESADSIQAITALLPADSSSRKLGAPAVPAVVSLSGKDTAAAATDTAAVAASLTPKAVAPKDNNKLWKEFADAVIETLKVEVLPSRKVKKGIYDVMVFYNIGTDGQVTIDDIMVSPEHDFLQQQIKTRLSVDTPRLNPVLSSSGTPRKMNKRYSFTLTKE